MLNLAVTSIYDDVKKRILDMADANGKGMAIGLWMIPHLRLVNLKS